MDVLLMRRTLSVVALTILTIPSLEAQKSNPPAVSNAIVKRQAPAAILQGCDPTRFITKAYQDVLQRPLDTAGSTYWLGLMKNGMSRTQVATQLLRSAEYSTVRLRALYSAYLHRPASNSDIGFFSSMLQQGTTIEVVRSTILGSNEYFIQRGGGTPQGFVAALYQDVLGRSADPQGVTFFSQQLGEGATRTSIAQLVLTSPEAQQRQVNALFLRYLHHPVSGPAPPGGEDQAAASIIGSDEYCRR